MSSRKTFHQFDTAQEAQDYRKSEGCGGWIFVSAATGENGGAKLVHGSGGMMLLRAA